MIIDRKKIKGYNMAKENNKLIVSIFSLAIFLLLLLLLLGTCNNNKEFSSSERFNNNVNVRNLNNAQNGGLKFNSNLNNNSIMHPQQALSNNNKMNAVLPAQQNIEEFTPSLEEEDDEPNEFNYNKDILTTKDLLPNDATSKWAQLNPAVGGDVSDQNFLTSGYHIGINTVGQSLRNANLQLRNEPINPQKAVSPWGISTIEPDVRSRGLIDVGSSSEYN